jgi:hypothetical protein
MEVVIEHLGGVQFEIKARGHVIVSCRINHGKAVATTKA